MKLWFDDVRPAPEGWTWARTLSEAKEQFAIDVVDEISLDFDLGMHHLTEEQLYGDDIDLRRHEYKPKYDAGYENGLHLVEWMIRNGVVPAKVTIHSWNPVGAKRMYLALNKAGHLCEYIPYEERR